MKTRVFVYGSLMAGFSNNFWLTMATYVGQRTTAEPNYIMFSLGMFPGVATGGWHAIHGEVYEVDDLTLKRLDRLEGHPNFYRRQPTILDDGTIADMYVLAQPWLKKHDTNYLPRVASGDWRGYTRSEGGEQ